MPISLPQQDHSSGFCIPKSVASPQHGQKADRNTVTGLNENRSFQPRPGHSAGVTPHREAAGARRRGIKAMRLSPGPAWIIPGA